ncbi:hypothetical protein [Terribacillus aidingensis]|uniref:hypothetical protein n=1 Tax=Terribacillus aidingensis TaxID=586416 RepID=UPI0015CD9DD4|nr:hypothetical protein [Terribacillus aidingensis]
MDDNRFYVRASNEFEATAFKSFFRGLKENIFQIGGGPKIDYLETIWGDNPRVIALQ